MPVNLSRPPKPPPSGEPRLYLKEDELDRAVDLLFLAARAFGKLAEPQLAARQLGPAHYRALAAIRRNEGLSVSDLLEALGVKKQSLARVLADLEGADLIAREPGGKDRRQRRLSLTETGRTVEADITAALRERLGQVFRACGPEAVAGARTVLAAIAEETESA